MTKNYCSLSDCITDADKYVYLLTPFTGSVVTKFTIGKPQEIAIDGSLQLSFTSLKM